MLGDAQGLGATLILPGETGRVFDQVGRAFHVTDVWVDHDPCFAHACRVVRLEVDGRELLAVGKIRTRVIRAHFSLKAGQTVSVVVENIGIEPFQVYGLLLGERGP